MSFPKGTTTFVTGFLGLYFSQPCASGTGFFSAHYPLPTAHCSPPTAHCFLSFPPAPRRANFEA